MNIQQSRRFLTIIVIVFLAIVTYSTAFNALNPLIGVRVTNQPNELVRVIEVEPGSIADSFGIEKGDIVLSINGESPHNFKTVKQQRIEQSSSFSVQKPNGQIEEYKIESKFDLQTIFQTILPAILSILILYSCYQIYRMNNKELDRASLYLIIFLLGLAIAYFSGGGAARGDTLLRNINIITFLSVPVLFIQFLYHYFSEIGKVWFKKWLYKLGYCIVFINFLIEQMIWQEYDYTFLKTTNLLSFLFLYLIVILVMVLGLKRIEYKAQKYLIRVLLLSNIIAISPFIIFYAIPYALFQVFIFSPSVLAAFLLIIPAALVYQFIAEKIHDIDFVIGRLRYHFFMGLVPALLCTVVVVLTHSEQSLIFIIRMYVFFLLIYLLTFYYKEILDAKFNHYSEKKNYQQSILQYTENLRTANNISQVIEELEKTILEITLVSDIQLVEIAKESELSNEASLILDHNSEQYRQEIKSCNKFIGQIIEINRGFIINVGEADKNFYLLVCTSKVSTPRLTRDEISYLKNLAHYTNVTLENFLKIENLMTYLENLQHSTSNSMWLNKVLYKLEEKKRSEVAKELHDSVLQDLISFQMNFEEAIERYLRKNGVTDDETQRMVDHIARIISTTRETCYELRPNVLYDLGLKKGIEKLAYQHEINHNIVVKLNVKNLKEPEDRDVQLNIYRIIQELLNNAAKHSMATSIKLIIVNIKDVMVIHYEDNGIGAPMHVVSKHGSMGLSGVRERVKLLEGTITIDTSPGAGFKVIIEI